MILKKIYDEKNHIQKIWYNSTMIYYTEMIEDKYENIGDLYVTFKNGTTYKYSKVSFEDYMVFIGGGTDASQGKTLNKIINSKYEYEKVGNADMQLLQEEFNKVCESNLDVEKTYFISGHKDITLEEFEYNYEPLINLAISKTEDAKFVVGDCDGVDKMAQDYLMNVLMISPKNVTVYHMMETPRYCNPLITNFKGGYQSDEEKDTAMTKASFEDIALVRDYTKISGTAQNILRRKTLKTIQ